MCEKKKIVVSHEAEQHSGGGRSYSGGDTQPCGRCGCAAVAAPPREWSACFASEGPCPSTQSQATRPVMDVTTFAGREHAGPPVRPGRGRPVRLPHWRGVLLRRQRICISTGHGRGFTRRPLRVRGRGGGHVRRKRGRGFPGRPGHGRAVQRIGPHRAHRRGQPVRRRQRQQRSP